MNGLLVSAAGTGAGKTLVTRALCAALRQRGRAVQPYKIGPDYIDGRITARAAGRPAYNVDLWLDGEARVAAHVAGTRGDADACIFEGMMGLFDGDDDGRTSSAAVALLLDLPVLLVLDGWSASQTLGAVAAGMRAYEPRLRIHGAVLNRAGGPAHTRAVARACDAAGIALLAAISYDAALTTPERHLGLDPEPAAAIEAGVDAVARRLAGELDLDLLFPPAAARPRALEAPPARARIAVAHDEAFWFTYPETLLALRAAGAEIVPFSPLHDARLPAGVRGLWLGGGYPELHAAGLADNAGMRAGIRDAVRSGLPTYAECGGMMYLARELETAGGRFPMAGAFDGRTSIAQPRLVIGYRRARTLADNPLDARGSDVRGYEFRYAGGALAGTAAYAFEGGAYEGVASATTLASFLHRHFTIGDPAVTRFVERCAA